MKTYLPREMATRVLPGHQPTVTRVRRLQQHRVVGEPAKRPCPHTLTAWDHIEDPVTGEQHREHLLLRRTLLPCERTDGHYRDLAHPELAQHRAGEKAWT